MRVEVEDGLELVPAPYIKNPSTMKYTLVLDLDETLLHYFEVYFKVFTKMSLEK